MNASTIGKLSSNEACIGGVFLKFLDSGIRHWIREFTSRFLALDLNKFVSF